MSNYDNDAAQQAGYAAGAVENEYDEAGQAWDRGEQRVENAPGDMYRSGEQAVDRAGQDIENAPSAIGGAISSAANWLGEKTGAVEKTGDRAEQGVQDQYNDSKNDVRNEYNDTRQDVDRFGQGVQNSYDQASEGVDRFGDGVQSSYDQGQQQGQREGW